MVKKKEQKAFYEADVVKNQLGASAGRAPQNAMRFFGMGKIFFGKMGMFNFKGLLDATIDKNERRALIITDSFTEKFAGVITELLEDINYETKIWTGARPDVPLDTVYEGASVCEEFKPNILFALGGGSVIDTAKLVMLMYEKPGINFHLLLPIISVGLRKKIKSLVAIPTTSGTGSEATFIAVATDFDRVPPKKMEIPCKEFLPDYVILDVDFVKDMPPFLTRSTGLDALAHSLGAYASTWGGPLMDGLNMIAIKEVMKFLPRAIKYGKKDLEAREKMHLAATIAGMGFGNSVTGMEHAWGHSFGAVFHVHHGATVGLFLPYTIAFIAKVSQKWKGLCPLFDVESEGKDYEVLLEEFIQALSAFMHSIGAPTCVKDLDNPKISKEEYMGKIDVLAEYALNDIVSLISVRTSTVEVHEKIFEIAWDGKDIMKIYKGL